VSNTCTNPGDPGVVGVNVTEVENGPRCPSGAVTDAVPDPITVFDASRTSTASWLCCVACPIPLTETGLAIVTPDVGVEMMIRSSVHPSSRHSQARSRPIAVSPRGAAAITNVVGRLPPILLVRSHCLP